MLQLLYGRHFSGKTTAIYEAVERHVKTGGRGVVLLVPEQFSFESERALLRRLKDTASAGVEVLSFSRLCDVVGRLAGGIAGKRVDEGSRLLLMGQAAAGCAQALQLYRRPASRASFAKTLVGLLEECKQNALPPQALLKTGEKLPQGLLRAKLQDLGLIFSAYDGLLKGAFLDPLDDLERLYGQLLDCPYFQDKIVFVDSFQSFTGAQLKVLSRVMSQAAEITVALCADGPDDTSGGVGLFSNVQQTGKRLEALAKENGVAIAPPRILEPTYYKSEALAALERGLSQTDMPPLSAPAAEVTLCDAATPAREVDYVVRTIRRLVRERGYRYRDFVIIARRTQPYEALVDAAMRRYGVPCYQDRRKTLSVHPLSALLDAALDLSERPRTQDILRYLKTGLGPLDIEQVSALENYAFVWELDGAAWFAPFEKDPAGLTMQDRAGREASAEALAALNGLRERAVAPLQTFLRSFHGTAEAMAKALYGLLTALDTPARLKAQAEACEAADELEQAEFLRGGWDAVMAVLDRLVACLPQGAVDPARLREMLKLALQTQTVGSIPLGLDEVVFGAAGHIRPKEPKVIFVIGLNAEEFPGRIAQSDLFDAYDRRQLQAAGLPLQDHGVRDAIEEQFLFYSSCCCASDRVYLTWHLQDQTGAATAPSVFIQRVSAVLPACRRLHEQDLPALSRAESRDAAFSLLAAHWKDGGELARALEAYFRARPQDERRIARLAAAARTDQPKLDDMTARRLFGGHIRLSATRVETYARCPFSYFCRYGLRARALEKADFNTLQRGTLVHYVLEQAVRKLHAGQTVPQAQIDGWVDASIRAYLSSILGFENTPSPAFALAIERMAVLLKALVRRIADELAQSRFEPAGCEVRIGPDGAVPPLRLPLRGGGGVSLEGVVDRVDLYEGPQGRYVRIVDYKTGSRSFKLSEVLYGLNVQMLLYLYTIVKNGGGAFGNVQPGGVLYMPSKLAVVNEEERDAQDRALRMNGLLCDAPDVLQAMEADLAGRYIPVTKTASNGLSKSASVAHPEAFQTIFQYLDGLLTRTGERLQSGSVPVMPVEAGGQPACRYCDYNAVCGWEPGGRFVSVPACSADAALARMKEGNGDDL